MLNPIFIKYAEAVNSAANSQLALCQKAAKLALNRRFKNNVAAGISLNVKLNVAAAIFSFENGKELSVAIESSGERANLNGHSERRALAILINQAITQKIAPFSSLSLIENTQNPSAETFARYKEALSTVKSITIFTERAPCTIKIDKPKPDASAAAAVSSSSSKSESEDNCHTFLDKLFTNKENLKIYYSVKLNRDYVMEADLSAQMQEARNIVSPSQPINPLNAAAAVSTLGSSSVSPRPLTEEEKARIEKNRLAALEKRAQMQAAEAAKVTSFVPPASSLASSAAATAAQSKPYFAEEDELTASQFDRLVDPTCAAAASHIAPVPITTITTEKTPVTAVKIADRSDSEEDAAASAAPKRKGSPLDKALDKIKEGAGQILNKLVRKDSSGDKADASSKQEESPRSKSANVAMSSPAASSGSEDDSPRPASAALTSSAASVFKAFEQSHASFPDSSSTTASNSASAGHAQTPALQLHIIQEQEKAKQEAQRAEQAAAAAKQVAKKQDSPPPRPSSR